MKRFLMAAIAAAVLAISPAYAQGKHHRHTVRTTSCPATLGCGCNMAEHLGGIARFGYKVWRDLWVAKNWRSRGEAAHKGCVGCVVVLSRKGGGHVGIVKGYDANGNPIVHSYANRRLGWTTATYSAKRVLAYRHL